MSYSRNYNVSVPYSGYVSYNYPASQSGGSDRAYFSGNVPVNVTINVNTNPFDSSVDKFKFSIGALGGSLTAMKVAQCAAIQKTTQEVSDAMINGFFGLIKTELSQQLQALDSAIKAGFGLIVEQGKAVSDKKNVLEGDYNRISSRYVRIFSDLDNECYKRIYTLDKQSFNLSDKVQRELLSESTSNNAALNLLGIDEVSSSKIFILISSMNRKVLEVLKTLHDYIGQESRIELLLNSFLVNEEIPEKVPHCTPVIWSESDMLEDKAVSHECFIPDFISGQGKQVISESVNKYCLDDSQSVWKNIDEAEKENLNREFNILAESAFANDEDEKQQRIYRTMLSLWQSSELISLERSL